MSFARMFGPAAFNTSHERRRFESLTGLRFIAASLVFIYHNRKFMRSSLHPELLRVINEFHLGVSIFFVLSGFFIAYAYNEKPLESSESFCSYVVIRFARIFPVYWLILTLYYLDPKYGNYEFSLQHYLLIHGFSNKLNLTALSQSWSLTVEITFYLFAPLIYFFFVRNRVKAIASLISVFLLCYIIGEFWRWFNGNQWQYLIPIKFLVTGTFFGRSFEFLIGITLAWSLNNRTNPCVVCIKNTTMIGFISAIICMYCIGLFQKNILDHGLSHPAGLLIQLFLFPCAVGVSIAGLIHERTWIQRILSLNIVVLLGNASFVFYLIHISYVNQKLKKVILLPDRNFILLWLIAIGVNLLIERPVYTVFKGAIRQWFSAGVNKETPT